MADGQWRLSYLASVGRLATTRPAGRLHTKNIYAKLGVNNRRAAVRRAEELENLPDV